MRELDDLRPAHRLLLLEQMAFGIRPIETEPAESDLIRLAGLTDKAIREWTITREHLCEYVAPDSPRRLDDLFCANDAAEDLVSALARAVRLARHLCKRGGHPELARLLPGHAVVKRLTGVRDAVEHIDEWTVWDPVSRQMRASKERFGHLTWEPRTGEAGRLAISAQGDRLHIADLSISFDELAEVLEAMSRVVLSRSSSTPEQRGWGPR
jgi:hypothetical protein